MVLGQLGSLNFANLVTCGHSLKIMALEIKGLQRIFKMKKNSTEMELADPDSNMSPSEVMDFYSMTYPELTTATVHGPEWENDRTVYRFKTTIGTKG